MFHFSKFKCTLPKTLFFFFLIFFSTFLLLGDELECIQPCLYRNVARQLNISVAMENVVSDAFLSVATEIFSAGTADDHCELGSVDDDDDD